MSPRGGSSGTGRKRRRVQQAWQLLRLRSSSFTHPLTTCAGFRCLLESGGCIEGRGRVARGLSQLGAPEMLRGESRLDTGYRGRGLLCSLDTFPAGACHCSPTKSFSPRRFADSRQLSNLDVLSAQSRVDRFHLVPLVESA